MRIFKTFLPLLLLGPGTVIVQHLAARSEPEIDRNSISVHPVRRGNMPIRLMANGEITSLAGAEVSVAVPSGAVPSPQIGQPASVQVKPPEVMIGSVVDVDRATRLDSWQVTIRLNQPFPAGAALGAKVDSLIEVGELKDVIYFERPASAHANAEMPLFVLEPNGEFARRTTVRFGLQSGALIQIVSGLSPGDMVIVTDTSQWNSQGRLRIK
jgi:hypothetical protein